jgi:hypothetical protein
MACAAASLGVSANSFQEGVVGRLLEPMRADEKKTPALLNAGAKLPVAPAPREKRFGW